MKITETTCVSDELCRLKGQIVSLGDSRIKRVRDLSMLTVRVVVLEYSQLHKKCVVCEFRGFENVLCDAGIRAIPNVYRRYDIPKQIYTHRWQLLFKSLCICTYKLYRYTIHAVDKPQHTFLGHIILYSLPGSCGSLVIVIQLPPGSTPTNFTFFSRDWVLPCIFS